MRMNRAAAETLALKAVSWLVSDEELLPVFLGATGASELDLRSRITDDEFLGSVLDFIMMDDAWVVAFCRAEGLTFESPMIARQLLPGGAQVNWT